MALIALYKHDLVIKTWMTFVVYQGFNLITSGIVMFGNAGIPLINKFSCKLSQYLGENIAYLVDSILPANRMVCRHDCGCSESSISSRYQIRFQNLDQQHWMVKQCHLLHHGSC